MWRKIVRILSLIPTVVGCLFIFTFLIIALSQTKEPNDSKIKLTIRQSEDQVKRQPINRVVNLQKIPILKQANIETTVKEVEKTPETSSWKTTEKPTSKPKWGTNQTIEKEKLIVYEHPYFYLHVPINICISSGATSDPFLLVVVKSDVNRIAHRMAIRATWGITGKAGLKVVFLLGYSPLMKTFVQMESNVYKDIVQESFDDDYRNNTLKTIMGFNWVSTHCPGAKYVFFVDDDYMVNIKYIWDHLHRLYDSGTRSIIMGFVWENAKPVRDENSKWFIPKSVYSEETWPPYASGGSLIVTPDIVNKLCNQIKFVKPIFVDDVYLGILCKKLGITWTHESRFYTLYRPDLMGYLFSSHGFRTPKHLLEDWNLYHKKLDMVV